MAMSKSKLCRTCLVQTDIPNTVEGGYLYAYAKIRPKWYWTYKRIRLFLSIVWRRWEICCPRIGVSQAWDIAKVAKGLTKKPVGKDVR